MSAELAVKEKVVGLKQTKKAIAAGKAATVFLAKDADARLTEPLRAMCRLVGVDTVEDHTVSELGAHCGIAVGTAACALLKK